MMRPDESTLRLQRLLAAGMALVTASAIVLFISSATGRGPFEYQDAVPPKLEPEQAIGLWAALDKESYLIGDIVELRIRIAWRPTEVRPDLDLFESHLNFFPFDLRSTAVTHEQRSKDIREYEATYFLQAVNVNAGSTYQLDNVTAFYAANDDANGVKRAVRAGVPPIFVGEYFPSTSSEIDLLPAKRAFDDAVPLRRWAMFGFAVLLILMVATYLWRFVCRRTVVNLSPAEIVWRELGQLRARKATRRQHLFEYEALAMRALALAAQITPRKFWTSSATDFGEMEHQVRSARQIFSDTYSPGNLSTSATQDSAEQVAETIAELISPMVDTARLQREQQSDFRKRLRQQPRVLIASAVILAVAVMALTLAFVPGIWLPGDIRRYNEITAMLSSDAELQATADAFAELAQSAGDIRVKSAAYYNLGVLLADPRLSRLSREQHRNFLQTIFLPAVTIEQLLHDMELDAERELVVLLGEKTRQYVRAEQALKSAVRTGDMDPAANRNLELLAKLRGAIAKTLSQLISQGEQNDRSGQMLGQTVIDLQQLMESELPDEYAKSDSGKDDQDYFIMERF